MAKLLNAYDDDDDEAEKPSSAQIVASIDDLLIQIIRHLSLKPLVQLRLVSNNWNSLISDSKLRLWHNRAAVGLIFERLDYGHSYILSLDKSIISPPIRKMTPTKDPWYQHCKIMHSCNGLLLCVSNPAHNLTQKYYVCNPTTKKYTALPQVVFDNTNESICGMSLAFDPSNSVPHYKVVCVIRSLGGLLHFFEVYSSKTGSWRESGELFKAYAHFDFEDGVYWNRAIHWVNIVTKPRECVYFSLDCDQTPKVFPNPPLQDKCYYKNDYYFGETCDHLYFIDANREVGEFNVYEMKRDYSEWFVKYKVNVPDAQISYSPISRERLRKNGEDWFMVVRGKNDEDWFLVFASMMMISYHRRITRYNLDQNICEILWDHSVFGGSKRPFQFIESHCPV
ncbi:hypothetical protein CASFOL_006819 [Castilleja foliolosa]|uniref:F-box domain-containing protein n=1 Tax=Castilleja foliolosa TaxID=1961234 RepID=A0ABD3E8F2_9LAMI